MSVIQHAASSPNKSPMAFLALRVFLAVSAWCSASCRRWHRWHQARRLSWAQFSGVWSRWAMVRTTVTIFPTWYSLILRMPRYSPVSASKTLASSVMYVPSSLPAPLAILLPLDTLHFSQQSPARLRIARRISAQFAGYLPLFSSLIGISHSRSLSGGSAAARSNRSISARIKAAAFTRSRRGSARLNQLTSQGHMPSNCSKSTPTEDMQ